MKKKIFIFQQREWANRIGVHLAKKFREDNFELGCLTFKRSTHYNIINDKKINYELIISNDDIYESPEKFINIDVDIETMCEQLNIKSIWELIYSDRDLSNSYDSSLHFSFKKQLSDQYVIDVFKAIYNVCLNVYNNFKPDIILAPNFPALTHLVFFHFFKKKNIKMLGMNDTKVGDYQAISFDYNHTEGMFHLQYDKINEKNFLNENKINYIIDNFYESKFYSYSPFNINTFLKQLTRDFVRDILESLKSNFNKIKRINQSKIFVTQAKKLVPTVRFYIVKIFNIISERFIKYDEIKINDNFAYMPLQFQPEASIDIQSVNYSNQIETARQIAMRLPNKMCLYVKDHPAMYGLRKKSYLLKIKSLPNVKLIDFRISTKEILEKSKILISATGSTFFEAAILRKSSILLGSLGDIIKLPNVEKLDEFSNLQSMILKKLDEELNTTEYTFKLKKYIEAAIVSGFDENYVRVWEKNVQPKEEEINYIYQKLYDCINLVTNKI